VRDAQPPLGLDHHFGMAAEGRDAGRMTRRSRAACSRLRRAHSVPINQNISTVSRSKHEKKTNSSVSAAALFWRTALCNVSERTNFYRYLPLRCRLEKQGHCGGQSISSPTKLSPPRRRPTDSLVKTIARERILRWERRMCCTDTTQLWRLPGYQQQQRTSKQRGANWEMGKEACFFQNKSAAAKGAPWHAYAAVLRSPVARNMRHLERQRRPPANRGACTAPQLGHPQGRSGLATGRCDCTSLFQTC
jgi:hypothetical protein